MKFEIRCVDLARLSPQHTHSINEVLMKSADATVFHTIEWNQLLTSQFALDNVTLLAFLGEKPVGLYCYYPSDGHRCLSPVVRLFTVYGGPVSASGDPQVVAALLREAEKLQPFASFQIWTAPNYDISPLAELGYSREEMYAPIVNLQATDEELWAKLHKKRRGAIRLAMKNDVRIVGGDSPSVDEYHEMMVGTLSRVQIDALPKSFYKQVLESLAPQGMARLLLAEHDGNTIAGAILLFYKDMAYDWVMGWRRDYLKVAPNDLLHWEAIKLARQEGYQYFDLLGLEPERLPEIARWKIRFGVDVLSRYYLQKATPGHQLWRVLRFITNPRRVVNRLRSFTLGKDDTS